MSEDQSARAIQERFAAWLRDGKGDPPPGFPPERARIYRELVLGNMSALLSSRLPRLRAALSDKRWEALVGDYLRSKRAQTPLFHRMGGEFVDWLMGGGLPPGKRRGYLLELAHFDWLSGELEVQPDPEGEQLLEPDAVERAVAIGWSGEAAVARYGHQVQLADEAQRRQPAEVHLLLRRTPQGEVRWEVIGAGAARLAEMLRGAESPPSLARLLAQMADETGMAAEELRPGVLSALRMFAERRTLTQA